MDHLTSLYPEHAHKAVAALFAALGPADRSPIRTRFDEDIADGRLDYPHESGHHPVFGLAVHSRGNDSGDSAAYSSGNAARGDLLSIPCYTEDGDVFLIETSFHKGDTYLERVDFPHSPDPVLKALVGLLEAYQTR